MMKDARLERQMLNRFQKIKTEFGTMILLRTILLLVGLVGMTVFGFFSFSSILVGVIAIAGLILGFLLSRQIAKGAEYYPHVITIGLFIYSIVLFLGDRLGIENNVKLAIIAATTVIVFDLQFWSLSDPSIVNPERSIEE